MASSDWASMYQNQSTSTYGNGYWPIVSDGTSGGLYQQYSAGGSAPIYNVPVTIEPCRMKSTPTLETGPHDHVIECRLTVQACQVVAEYFCYHCNEIVHSKVISKLPKSILNKKCLPRLVKNV